MNTKLTLKNKTIFITGCTRGIGRAIALRAARDGANIIVTGKSKEPQEKLKGTLDSVAAEIKAAGGNAVAIQLDVRDAQAIEVAVSQAAEYFKGIDILVNNASAIDLTPIPEMPMSRFDLLQTVNARATFATIEACVPYLKKSSNPHILTMSPPLNMQAKWFSQHLAYTMSKYGMSMCTLGFAAALKDAGIAVNSLWPKTTMATAAIAVHMPQLLPKSRDPKIVADAAYFILTSNARENTGNFYIDENVLAINGITDVSGV